MADTSEAKDIHYNATSAHVALGAGLISSTLFLVAASVVAVGCLVASTQPITALEEGSDVDIRLKVWGFLSVMNVIIFYIFGIVGMRKVLRGYKEFDQMAKR